MDRDDLRKNFTRDLESQDTYDTRQAKQRASIKWLLSKAYNNRVPDNLKEPFYRDHEDQEHLKPQIVHNLANAEMYCLAFANIYSDPNYHNLNHWGFLQTLARKGIAVPDPPDGPLTETVLIQTTPIKLGAHMSVIEATMLLYAKEVVTPDRVVAAVHRFTHGDTTPELPRDSEDGLLLWVNQAQAALTRRTEMELEKEGRTNVAPPRFPEVKDVKGLCDGVGLAALISFYCPEELPWTDIKAPGLPTVSDSIHNLCLVHEFSHNSLPHSVCHMMPEDVTYLRGNMKQNLLVLLADLFNVLEIHPVKCVRFPGSERNRESFGPARNSQGVAHKRSLPQAVAAIPDLRSNLATHSSFTVSKPVSCLSSGLRKSHSSPHSDSYFRGSPDSLDRSHDDRRSEESFVVHRGRGVPTLSSVITEDPLLPARLRPNKERGNQDSKADERGELNRELNRAAGKPSNWEDSRRPSYAGRRSRRNSLSEDSQLTLENFGGSQENLHLLGRNPDKEPAVHVGGRLDRSEAPSPGPTLPLRTSAQEARSSGVELIFADNEVHHTPVQRRDSRKSPSPAPLQSTAPPVPIRSSQQDARSNAIERIFADNGYGIEKHDEEKSTKEASLVSLKNLIHSKQVPDLNDSVDGDGSRVLLNSLANDELGVGYLDGSGDHVKPQKSSLANRKPGPQANGNEKKTTFAVLPNTTTWQQQRTVNNVSNLQEVPNITDDTSSNMMQLHNVRLKLEEKRRCIESEKKRMEIVLSKQRQKVGKAAFLQAVTKGKLRSPESDPGVSPSPNGEMIDSISTSSKPQRPFSFQDMKEEGFGSDRKWMDVEERKTPDMDNIDMEQYQHSIAQMNSSLKEIEADMQMISHQQSQIGHQGFPDESRLSQQLKELASQQQKQFASLVSQQQQLQTFASQMSNNYGQTHPIPAPKPSTFTSYSHSGSPQSKSISLSQLHQQTQPPQQPQQPQQPQFFLHEQPTTHRRTWSQQHAERTWNQGGGLSNGSNHPTPSPRSVNASPQHSKPAVPPRAMPPPPNPYPAPVPTPSADDMEPQSICFIGDGQEDELSLGMSHINITSGSRTYRIPSPTRPMLNKNPFQKRGEEGPPQRVERGFEEENEGLVPEKGFYISFDDEAPPKRPKPPLRGKRNSPKKERFATQVIDHPFESSHSTPLQSSPRGILSPSTESPRSPLGSLRDPLEYSPDGGTGVNALRRGFSPLVRNSEPPEPPATPGVGLVIGTDVDPNAIDEMERKKEKILLQSLQRRQQQEEAKERKEMETAQRREIEKMKEEDKARKKDEEKARRAAILEQYKLKKAIEEAEREGKVLDKSDLMKLATPKMRSKTTTTPRPRPKTIHVESHGMEDGMLTPARGKKGSSSNLTARTHEVFTRPLRRDQYRGSQDSLASTMGRRTFRDSPSDDGRGTSPSRIGSSNLGRRGSYKTSRDTSEPPSQVRGRSKYSTYQSNFRGRKSNSLMNLCGSSSDQDSMVYRYGDTDSGLGRATPPRRAPSPGMTCGRHLTSPSGPGSLPPGLISKRRIFDDGSSDISSNASSMMDYTGPRLYKQPATKSNRGIMLNAVEYCVFPGVVNREAKRRVLEEISRSESKHFLILFRDAGCQFRALYSYCPDTEEVMKLYGTGPKQVNDRMFDKFFKYNSGGKCFSQVHTKHLTVTIDAFTIHNSLWQGKKVNLPSKKDMALVI